jgi:ectoine hydroxylase-related dioxygenase (phytanoyl-CoA dioxygenase family)
MQGSSNACVIWVPLVDCSKELGALQVLPSSHKNGLQTTSVENGFGMVDVDGTWTDLECKAGDAVIFHSMLVHRSGQHSSDNIRWSCHFRYNDLLDPAFIERGFVHPYIYEPVKELL